MQIISGLYFLNSQAWLEPVSLGLTIVLIIQMELSKKALTQKVYRFSSQL